MREHVPLPCSILVIPGPIPPLYHQNPRSLSLQSLFLVIPDPIPPQYHQNPRSLSLQSRFLVIPGLSSLRYHQNLSSLSLQPLFLVIPALSSPLYHQNLRSLSLQSPFLVISSPISPLCHQFRGSFPNGLSAGSKHARDQFSSDRIRIRETAPHKTGIITIGIFTPARTGSRADNGCYGNTWHFHARQDRTS